MMMNTDGGEDRCDRISELADDILCHILWFLPTEEAVATCLLSKRWRFLWHLVPALDFDITKPRASEKVDKFLSLRRTEKITRFCLKSDDDNHLNLQWNYLRGGDWLIPRYVDKGWFSAATEKGKVEHMNIVSIFHTSLPTSIFTCTTIVSLKLKMISGDAYVFPSSVNLPSLKTFHLHEKRLGIMNVEFPLSKGKNLIYGSPALELFHHRHSTLTSSIEVKIMRSSQHIRLFERCVFPDFQRLNRVIQSDPNYDFIPHYFENHLEYLVKAKVYITESHSDTVSPSFLSILKQVVNVEFLSLAPSRTKSLDIPLFQNLVQLRLYLKDRDCAYKILPIQCPKLQYYEFVIMDDSYDINKTCPYHDLSIVPF